MNLTTRNLERVAQQKLSAAYAKRREIVKSIPKFWPVALMNNEMVAVHIQHSADQLALSYLEDLWVERDKAEPRCYTIEFVGYLLLPVDYDHAEPLSSTSRKILTSVTLC